MKILILALVMSSQVWANIPAGKYKVEKIVCSTGKELKLGGKFMKYDISLNVTTNDMTMTAIAHSADWAPFKLKCTQVNYGSFDYVGANQYEGYLALKSVRCNAKAWENILKKHLFGIEDKGLFTYKMTGNKLQIYNPQTSTPYSCEKTGGYPIYHYVRI